MRPPQIECHEQWLIELETRLLFLENSLPYNPPEPPPQPAREVRIVDEEARGVAYYAKQKIQKHLNPIKKSKYS